MLDVNTSGKELGNYWNFSCWSVVTYYVMPVLLCSLAVLDASVGHTAYLCLLSF